MLNAQESSKNKRPRGGSNLADDDYIHLTKSTEKEPVVEIHKGLKNFWRSRNNIELNFMFHPLLDCVEIQGYEHSKELQTTKLYACASIVSRRCQSVDSFKDNIRQQVLTRKKPKISDADSLVDALREHICQFLITKIDLISDITIVKTAALPEIKEATAEEESSLTEETPAEIEKSVEVLTLKFIPPLADPSQPNSNTLNDFEMSCPVGLQASAIIRPRRSTSLQFDSALCSLQIDQAKLAEENDKAARLTTLMRLGGSCACIYMCVVWL